MGATRLALKTNDQPMARGNFDRGADTASLLLRKHLPNEANPVTCPALATPLRESRCSLRLPLFFLLLIATCGLANAGTPKEKPLPCGLTDAEAASLNGDTSTDIHAVSNYSNTMYGLLQAGKFEQLDCLADSARSHKETFSGGLWKIHAVYSGLASPRLHPTQEDWTRHIESLQRWLAARPESITARVALAECYVGYGWDARGNGLGDSVSESGWKLLAERAAKARQLLEQSAPANKDPEWFVAMQDVALAQGWEPDARQALLDQGVKFEPAYYYYYRSYAYSILPKWGGEDGEVATFLQKAADHIGGDAGDMMYFRVATTLLCACQSDQELNLSWRRIQKGFAAVENQNGPSLANWNNLAHLAQSFGDAYVADKMFAKIGDQWSEDVWKAESSFESSKEWAKHMAPMMARQRIAEEPAEANLQTPEGQRYKSAMEEKIHTLLQVCSAESAANAPGTYELLIKVGKAGTVDDVMGLGFSPAAFCLHNKLAEFRQAKQVVFPPPPQPDYWVRFDVVSENAAAAALK